MSRTTPSDGAMIDTQQFSSISPFAGGPGSISAALARASALSAAAFPALAESSAASRTVLACAASSSWVSEATPRSTSV
jgi:hypothetical protein